LLNAKITVTYIYLERSCFKRNFIYTYICEATIRWKLTCATAKMSVGVFGFYSKYDAC